MSDHALTAPEPGPPATPARPGPDALATWSDPLRQLSLMELAGVLDASGLYSGMGSGRERHARIVATVLWGHDLGLRPLEALADLHIIKGQPSLGANLLLRRLREHARYDYRIHESTDTACEIEIMRDDRSEGRIRWTIQQARAAGLRSQAWQAYPRDMLRSRAVTAAVRTYAPDLLGRATAYTREELEQEPRPVVATVATVVDAPAPTRPAPPTPEQPAQAADPLDALRAEVSALARPLPPEVRAFVRRDLSAARSSAAVEAIRADVRQAVGSLPATAPAQADWLAASKEPVLAAASRLSPEDRAQIVGLLAGASDAPTVEEIAQMVRDALPLMPPESS